MARLLNVDGVLELNGVSNIHIEVTMALQDGKIDSEVASAIKNQLDLIERYTLAHYEANQNKTIPPFWHDVIANPSQYPTRKERYAKS